MWQEFSSSKNHTFGKKKQTTWVCVWQNTHKKLSPKPLSLSLADNNPSRLLYRTHPCTHPTSHYVHRFGGAHCANTKTPDSKPCLGLGLGLGARSRTGDQGPGVKGDGSTAMGQGQRAKVQGPQVKGKGRRRPRAKGQGPRAKG